MTGDQAKSTGLDTLGLLRFCWRSAGGWKSTRSSFDFRLAILVWVLCIPTWLRSDWPAQVISVLPNLLGFTLGGFAVFLGFGSDDFKGVLTARKPQQAQDETPYMSMSAAFLFFVIAQLTALLYALVATALYSVTLPAALHVLSGTVMALSVVGAGLGYFIFIFSLTLALRAAIRVFRLSRWYNAFLGQIDESEP